MSKPNKVNKDHYTQRGRLTPDEFARERARDIHVSAQRRLNERPKRTTTRRAEQESNPERTEREGEE